MDAETAAKQIARTYQAHEQHAGPGSWMSITRIAYATDLRIEELHAGIQHLYDTNDKVNIVPESNQRMLTDDDRMCAMRVGGQDNHLICIQAG